MPNSGSTHSCCNCGAHDYMLTMCKVDNNQEHVDFKNWKKRMAISPEEVANMRGEFLRRQWIEYWQQEWWDKCSFIWCSIIRVCIQEWAMYRAFKKKNVNIKKCGWSGMSTSKFYPRSINSPVSFTSALSDTNPTRANINCPVSSGGGGVPHTSTAR